MKKGILIIFITLLLIGIAEAANPGAPPGPPVSMTLNASSPDVQAGGIYTTIIATLKDSNGQPSPEANVYFNTTFGTINTSYGFVGSGWLNLTDNNGIAIAVLKRPTNESATITASSGTINATITISDTPTTITVTTNPTAVATIPPVSTAITPVPTTPGATSTGTAPVATTPGTTAQTPAVTTPATTAVTSTPATTTPRTPGFGIVISILVIIILSTKTFRRK